VSLKNPFIIIWKITLNSEIYLHFKFTNNHPQVLAGV
jgi:hypothetical protein